MQRCSRERQAMNTLLSQQQQQQQEEQVSLQDLQNHHHQIPFDPTSSHDDFLDQMLSSINPSSCSPWPDLSGPTALSSLKSSASAAATGGDDQTENDGIHHQEYHFVDQSSAMLASKLRHHQINSNGAAAAAAAAAKGLMLQQHLMLSRGLPGNGLRSSSGDNGLLPMPLSLGDADQNGVVDGSSFKSANPANDTSVQALYNGFAGSLGQTASQPPHFHHPQGGAMQAQNFGGAAAAAAPSMNQAVPPSGSTGACVGSGGGAPAQPRQQRVRARRGQATDPHSIAERLRRERIAERMKALQELVPNANKTDKASMLDEIIDYVKFLQLQVKVLSMSRLGGAAAVAPLVADMSSEAGGGGGRTNGTQTAASSNNDTMTVTEHQVAKLMEEDMGSAMQYLQGKGLCLMPISLATAISTATCHSRNPPMNPNNHHSSHNNNPLLLGSNGTTEAGGPSSPSMSVLTVQSATLANGAGEPSVKDAASVSKFECQGR